MQAGETVFALDGDHLAVQPQVPPLCREFGEPRRYVDVFGAQHPTGAADHGDLDAQGREHVRELRAYEPGAHDDHPAGQLVEPHHRIAGVVADLVQARDVRDRRVTTGGHHDPVGADRLRPSGGVHGQLLDAGEPGEAFVEGDIRVVFGAVAAATGRDLVDPAEDPVPDVAPAHVAQFEVDAELRTARRGAGDVSGVHEHLRRDAADVQAGAAVGVVGTDTLVDHGDVPIGEPVVDDRVAGTGTDDD